MRGSPAATTTWCELPRPPTILGRSCTPTQAADSGQQSPTDKSLAEFELAVRLDPSNVTAQRNLEVLLRIVRSKGKQQQTRVGAGDRLGTKGSGSREPGHGY